MLGVVFGLGMHYGKKSVKLPTIEPVIEYIEAEPIHDTIKQPGKPYKVVIPADTLDIIKQCIADGLYKELWPENIVEVHVDTIGSILRDWATERSYKETLFDSDTLGTCVVDVDVKYNRLNSMSYEFTPIVRNVEHQTFVVKKWSPFVSAGAMFGAGNEMPEKIGEIGGGLFYNERVGAELKYQRSFTTKNDYLGGSILLKF